MKKLLHTGNIVLTGFALMIIFMSYLVFRCTRNPVTMVSDKYYEEEMTYQTRIDARKGFEQLQQEIKVDRVGDELRFHFPDTLNQQTLQTCFTFYHVANSHKDYQVTMPKNNDGVYSFQLHKIMPGHYRVKMQIDATHDQRYYHEIPLSI